MLSASPSRLARRSRLAWGALLALAVTICAPGDGFGQEASEPLLCPPVKAPIDIDGNLSEWEGQAAFVIDGDHLTGKDDEKENDPEKHAGASDLSGRIWVARSATSLYVAGEVLDDTLFWNNAVTWLGDGVELFFDFSPDFASREPDDGYDEYCYQLMLYPLASELNWKFQKFRGVDARADLEVDGVRPRRARAA